jgi:manganese catalase
MFIHNKDLQFEVRVTEPDPRFARLLQEQFGGANGELKAAMQYFTQAFLLRGKNPKMYDLFMDIATEELSHLEMVGSMITMLLDGLNDDLKLANERCDWMPALMNSASASW